MPPRPRPLLAALLLAPAALLRAACAPALAPDDIIRSAQQRLIEDCLKRQGLKPTRPHEDTNGSPGGSAKDRRERQEHQQEHQQHQERTTAALFGTGPTELSLQLPTGYTVRAHTDGCLAAAQRTLYGDQRRWFRVSTIANNLRPEAAHRNRSLASVRAEHREELADWRTLRARALHQAKTRLNN